MPFAYGNYGDYSVVSPAATTAGTSRYGQYYRGSDGLIPLFILVGLLALFIPRGGFFIILGLILLLILVCSCGVCGHRY